MSEYRTAPRLPSVFKEYEDGKHRRYELLFKVNGAAFAIIALAAKAESAEMVNKIISLRALAVLMMIFTIVMGCDIFAFGWNMKQVFSRQGKIRYPGLSWLGPVTPITEGLFKPIGMGVLAAIVILLVTGWGFVAAKAP